MDQHPTFYLKPLALLVRSDHQFVPIVEPLAEEGRGF